MRGEDVGSTPSPSPSSNAADEVQCGGDGNGNGNGMTLKECEEIIQKTFSNPKVKILVDNLEKSGCKLGTDFIEAVNNEDKKYADVYLKGRRIEMCSDRIQCQKEVETTAIHELIHAYDECHGANLDWGNSAHYACNEIRANHVSGQCKSKNLKGQEYCVKWRTKVALVIKHSLAEAEDPAFEAVWRRCYNDTAPFDKPP